MIINAMNAGQAKVYISFWNGEGSVIISLSSCGDVFLLFRNTFRLLSMEKHNAKRTAAMESIVKYTVVYFSVPIIFKAVFPATASALLRKCTVTENIILPERMRITANITPLTAAKIAVDISEWSIPNMTEDIIIEYTYPFFLRAETAKPL